MSKSKLSRTWVVCLLAMVCCALWGSAFPCIKLGYKYFGIQSGDYGSQIIFAGTRFMLAGIIVVAISSFGRGKFIKPAKPGRILVLSVFQTVLQYTFFYIGLASTTGVKSAIINGAGVFMTLVVSAMFFKQEKLTDKKILGSILGFLGILLINLAGSSMDMKFSLEGEGFILISALASAFSSAFIKKYSRNTDVVMLSGYQFMTGGAILTFLGFYFGGKIQHFSNEGIGILVYLSFVSAIAYTLWSILLKYNSVSKVSVYKFMNPIFGAGLSALIISQESGRIDYVTITALILVCLGIWIVNREK